MRPLAGVADRTQSSKPQSDAAPAYTRARNRHVATTGRRRETRRCLSRLRTLIGFFRHSGGHSASAPVHDSRVDGHECPPHMGRFGVLIRENLVSLRPAYAPRATAGKNFLAALGLHARAESMLLGPLAPVGLECTFGHEELAAPDCFDSVRANRKYKSGRGIRTKASPRRSSSTADKSGETIAGKRLLHGLFGRSREP